MFDFALYENVTTGINHQKDLHIISKLLTDSGYSVCILGYCKEQDLGDGIPFISIPNPYRVPEMENGPKWTLLIRKWRYYFNKKRYILHFLNATKGIAHNYYCGSFLKETDIRFLQQTSSANYFFWGLRSHFLSMNIYDILHPITALDKFRKIHNIKRNKNIKFFISSELIRTEFNNYGISSERLVLRPERYVDSNHFDEPSFQHTFSFLSIGTIRQEKRIPMAISAFLQINNQNCLYNIAGKCNNEKLNTKIRNLTKENPHILRNENRLNEQEYQEYFNRCHFLLLCDVKQQSSVTNGTMMEALLMGKPIIAPNYNPYKYYIEKYHIGLLFDGYTVESLKSKMEDAIVQGAESFQSALNQFRKQFLYNTVQQKFNNELRFIGIIPAYSD